MLTKLAEGMGDKLQERLSANILTASLFFWVGGLCALLWHFGPTPILEKLNQLPPPTHIALIVGSVLVVIASSIVVRRFDSQVVRCLEGYWPRWMSPLRSLFVSWQRVRTTRVEQRFNELLEKGLTNFNDAERHEFTELDWHLMNTPALPAYLMPTRLGNILRAAELRPSNKYGLDTIICWPRLWLILPERVQHDLEEAREALDTAAQTLFWGLLFIIWTVWAWWAAIVGLLIILFSYQSMLRAAQIYGSLLESTFDLYRNLLYRYLRWPLPKNPSEERLSGESLTAYLWRGSNHSAPAFEVFDHQSALPDESH